MEQVKQFMTAFNQQTYDSVNIESLDNLNLVNLRYNLINEEFNELLDGIKLYKTDKYNGMREIADALGDLLVVTYGTKLSFGLTHCDENKYLLYLGNYFNCDINNYYVIQMVDELTNCVEKLKYYLEIKNINLISYYLNNIIKLCYDISYMIGINIKYVFDNIHESNMTKLCKSELEAQETVNWYKENDSKRYPDPYYELSNDGIHWIVKNKSSGKVLKSINYKEPDFVL